VISIVVGCLLYIKGIFFAKFILDSSRVIQKKLISVLLKTPLGWFDVTPTGRILARTTKDQDDLDNNLSFNFQSSTQNICILITSVLLISIATPLYLIIAVLSSLAYHKVISMYMNSSR
jgi:ABC-type multidrug transport system fused ATPase/permease subunit